jgi:hypothetical protein
MTQRGFLPGTHVTAPATRSMAPLPYSIAVTEVSGGSPRSVVKAHLSRLLSHSLPPS